MLEKKIKNIIHIPKQFFQLIFAPITLPLDWYNTISIKTFAFTRAVKYFGVEIVLKEWQFRAYPENRK
jgi:ABC-type molybdate transport system permease subunit